MEYSFLKKCNNGFKIQYVHRGMSQLSLNIPLKLGHSFKDILYFNYTNLPGSFMQKVKDSKCKQKISFTIRALSVLKLNYKQGSEFVQHIPLTLTNFLLLLSQVRTLFAENKNIHFRINQKNSSQATAPKQTLIPPHTQTPT